MTTRLSTFHDLGAVGIVRAFVAETGRYFGADETEKHQLELAAEEAAAFIIDAFRPDPNELFEIEAEPIDNGLRFLFRNKGIPVDEENLPVYDSRHPEASMAGLSFFLLESLTDALQFRNEGNRGWVLVFEKRFRRFKPLRKSPPLETAAIDACAKEKLEAGLATPADAYDIVKLTYLTYRYSYVKRIFYYRKELEEAIASGRVIAFVAKNREGEVVVNSAYFRSPHCNAIAEAGMLMSRPEYRKNRALLRVSRMQVHYLKEGKGGLRAAYAKLVTAHTRSQKLVSAYRFVPTALKLSVHDPAEFVGIETDEVRRESLLYALLAPNGLDPTTLYLPKEHVEITHTLIQDFETLSLHTESRLPERQTSEFTVEKEERDRYALITIEHLGQDWAEGLRRRMKELSDDGIITLHLHIPADRPLPPDFEKTMARLRLFYSGVVIKTMAEWDLVYTHLQGQRFDFDAVMLSDERAIALREYMRKAHARVEEV
ncbi:ATP-binding protein [Hydrogenimonas urashimensis]|uniref:ATP-binding protein n=1 Tax=Hydrogenimonas urashimensis TaxID=2740515 RepID=UPI0019151918|nr:ATP-binding protein [Hydrogenimonas urashimensis]